MVEQTFIGPDGQYRAAEQADQQKNLSRLECSDDGKEREKRDTGDLPAALPVKQQGDKAAKQRTEWENKKSL